MSNNPLRQQPLPGVVVILVFKCMAGRPSGALGLWSGTSWFCWRQTNAGMTGEPNNWHPVEDHLIRGWSDIPPGALHTIIPDGAGPHELMTVEPADKPYQLMGLHHHQRTACARAAKRKPVKRAVAACRRAGVSLAFDRPRRRR